MGNSYGKKYFDDFYKLESNEREQILKYHLKFLLSRKKQIGSILDVGCALGEFLSFCDQANIETFGLEISDYAVSQARKRTKATVKIVDVSKDRWPFKGSLLDAVTAFDLLEHTQNSDFVIAEAFRVLNKGGIFLASTPNGDLEGTILGKVLLPYDPTHINVKGAKFWKESFQRVGFKDIRIQGCFSFGFPPSPRLRNLLSKVGIRSTIKPIFCPILQFCGTLFIVGFKN
ncbi:class I SAM-dependent methyltransferase [Candidatus Daviesbacteria bacterium]|nr:class I SAM-dependent methyltransferase [Candidatus Daviesbacteria bacterium]